MSERTPEDVLLITQYKSSAIWLRHVVATVTNEKDAEMIFRDLNQMCRLLVPKFRKGNGLSRMLSENSLQASGKVVQSPLEARRLVDS